MASEAASPAVSTEVVQVGDPCTLNTIEEEDEEQEETGAEFKELRQVEARERSEAFFTSQKIKVYLTAIAGHEFSFDVRCNATVRDVKQLAWSLRERTWDDGTMPRS